MISRAEENYTLGGWHFIKFCLTRVANVSIENLAKIGGAEVGYNCLPRLPELIARRCEVSFKKHTLCFLLNVHHRDSLSVIQQQHREQRNGISGSAGARVNYTEQKRYI